MSVIDQPVTKSQRQAAEQRAFRRQSLRLPAAFRAAAGAADYPCEIRDFCPGGMHLVYASPESLHQLPTIGEIITLRCDVPPPAGPATMQFRARIVRTGGDSAGVALLQPRTSDLRLLQELAKEQTAAEAARAPAAGGAETPAAASIIDAYRRLVAEALTALLGAFMEAVDNRLFDLAERATSVTSEGSYFTAQRILRRSDVQLRQAFDSAVMSRMYAAAADPNAAGSAQPAETSATLTLVDHQALEFWLAVSDVASHVESRNTLVLAEIEQRLSHLHQRPIGRDTNPVGPAVFAQAFQDAIGTLQLEHAMTQVCFSVFKGVLNDRLQELYKAINTLLIDKGVLPQLKPRILRQPGDSTGKARTAAIPDDPPAVPERPAARSVPGAADAAAVDAGDTGRSPRGGSARGAGTRSDAGPDDALGDYHAAAPQGTRAHAAGDAPDLYRIVQDLRALQGMAGPRAGDAAAMTAEPLGATSLIPAATAAVRPAQYYATEEILHALSHLRLDADSDGDVVAPIQGPDLQSRVIAALAGVSPGAAKSLADREGGIIDVAARLFDSLLQDMFVAGAVRTWLQRLKIPVLKRAIVDDTLFIDTGHEARRVLNRVSQLELYGDDRDRAHGAVKAKINALIDRIAADVDSDPEVFSKALKELDLLIQIQNEAYGDNLREVIMECEQDETGGHAAPGGDGGAAAAARPPVDEEWLRRARRLRVGGWMLLNGDSDEPLRIRLAWVSKAQDRFVFVNLRGQRELTLDIAELARWLHDGSAVILDNADEPAIDRAQYTMLQSMHRKLVYESTHDQLTGLVNRREFERHLREVVRGPVDGERTDTVHSLCYLDIHKFGIINTACGYDAGDRLLTEICGLLQKVLGGRALLGRIGGDEFAALFRGQPLGDALRHLNELLGIARDYRFTWKEQRFAVSFGVGVVQISGDDDDPAALLQAAESSCLASKRRGANHVHVFRPDDTGASDRGNIARWAARIDKALDDNHLELRYQRIMPLRTDGAAAHPCHAEVLMTITDESGAPISPQQFIIAAEHYDRMPAIDRLVIGRVFRWMARHSDRLAELGGLAINLSGRSLSDATLMAFILDEAKRTAAPLDRLCFEVTETAGVSNLSDAAEFILEMKKTGCRFSLDDFGSGLSSYAYLKTLPVDYLKIDGAFVKNLDSNPSDFAVVKSISEIGHFMGKRIIAEYVETAAALERLRDMGIDYAQGYFIDRPHALAD